MFAENDKVHQLMILDQADMNLFFESLEGRLPQEAKIPAGRGNEEITNQCNFGMTSHMMKELAPALKIYRYLTSGLV